MRHAQEGELRPQLLDRFGLSVQVSTLMDVDVRTQMVLDRLAYDQVRQPQRSLPAPGGHPARALAI